MHMLFVYNSHMFMSYEGINPPPLNSTLPSTCTSQTNTTNLSVDIHVILVCKINLLKWYWQAASRWLATLVTEQIYNLYSN